VTASDVPNRRYPATQLRPDLRCQISAASGGVDNASLVPCFSKQTTDKTQLTALDLPRIQALGAPLSINQRHQNLPVIFCAFSYSFFPIAIANPFNFKLNVSSLRKRGSESWCSEHYVKKNVVDYHLKGRADKNVT
jgi:hypothetical protein